MDMRPDYIKAVCDRGIAMPVAWDKAILEDLCHVHFTKKQWQKFCDELPTLGYSPQLEQNLIEVVGSIASAWLERKGDK
jgi:hypothetical protein